MLDSWRSAKISSEICYSMRRNLQTASGASASEWLAICLVFLNAVLSTAAEVLLKIGASQPLAGSFPAPIAALSVIATGWVLLGIVAYIGSLFLWLVALRRLPLHLAYGLASSVHLLVPLASWLVLHETIPYGRLLGMLFILAGIVLLGFSHEQVPKR
jgi:multidrug transporter EmrE-like cation transporter